MATKLSQVGGNISGNMVASSPELVVLFSFKSLSDLLSTGVNLKAFISHLYQSQRVMNVDDAGRMLYRALDDAASRSQTYLFRLIEEGKEESSFTKKQPGFPTNHGALLPLLLQHSVL